MSRHKPPPHQAKKRGREKRRRPLTLAVHRTFAPQSEVTLPPNQPNPDALGWTALMPRPKLEFGHLGRNKRQIML